jgi:putative peptidoglycan lipid II flippase
MSTGITTIVALTAPASAALIVLATPIVQVFMERGQFDPTATANTSSALRGLAIGLVGFSVYLFTLRGFYANHDTRTPFMLNLFENALNIVLAILLVGPFGVAGLGTALGLAYLIAAVAAVGVLRRRWAPSIDVRSIAASIVNWLAAGAGAGAIMEVTRQMFDTAGSSTISRTASLSGSLAAGLVTYWMAAVLVRADGVPTVSALRAALSRATARGRHDG